MVSLGQAPEFDTSDWTGSSFLEQRKIYVYLTFAFIGPRSTFRSTCTFGRHGRSLSSSHFLYQ